MSRRGFQKGYTPWNVGKGSAPQISVALKGKKQPWSSEWHKALPEDKHPRWKGDDVGYHVLHRWVQKHKGKPSFCNHCLSTSEKRYEWANISGEYKRDLDDWTRLCRSCHIKYDKERGLWGKSNARKTQGVVLF